MIVDASALIAVLREEPERSRVREALLAAGQVRMASAGSDDPQHR